MKRTRVQDVLRAEFERAFGLSATRMGLVTPSQVEEALGDGKPLAEALMARGRLTAADAEAVWAELAKEEFRRSSAATDTPHEAAAADPAHRIAEFILVSPLGRGGAGEVWKAWDTSLRRWVAFKRPTVLLSKIGLDRFHREAAAAAKLHHPNIVPVHRVGVDNGRPYIVFQLIEGKSLQGSRLPVRESLRLIEMAARAVDYAHAQGVIHRDLKPGNLMVDSEGRVWILDFGLAHLDEGQWERTAPGAVIGTPAYMSPEQARGEQTAQGRPTDVYSLGATLYDLVTGRPPFEATEFADLVHRVATAEPPRPRALQPDLDLDLETILLKAMHRDPSRRYESAGALADDLGHLLAGRPISARPPGPGRRILDQLRKYRTALAFASLVLVAGGFWASAALERRAALAAVRDTARSTLEAMLQLRRNGQNSGMRAFLPPFERAYQDAVRRAPGLAEPEYEMGRLSRALFEDDRALEFQERALSKEAGFLPALRERSLLLSRRYGLRYRRAQDSLRALDPAATPTRDRVEAMDPDLAGLRAQVVRDGDSEGLLAYYEDRLDDARRLLEAAVAKEPDREEVWTALAGTVAAQAARARSLDEKLRLWGESEELYGKAIARDRGYLPHYFGRGDVRLQRGKQLRQFGRDPLPDFAKAEEDFSVALSLEPGAAEAWLRRGETRTARAVHEADAGREPFAHHAAAEEDLSRAVELGPAVAEAWMRRGLVRTNRGVFREERKLDGRQDFAAADLDFGKALELDREYATAWHWRGIERANSGIYAHRRGADGAKDLAAASADLDRALALRPDSPGVWLWKGISSGWTSQVDAPALVEQYRTRAEQAYGRALELNPDYADAYFWRALLRQKQPGREAEAESDFTQVIRINPAHWDARHHRGLLRLAIAEKQTGDEARRTYASAADDFREAVRLNPAAAARLSGSLQRAERLSHP